MWDDKVKDFMFSLTSCVPSGRKSLESFTKACSGNVTATHSVSLKC